MIVLLLVALGTTPASFQLDPTAPRTVRYHVSATLHDVTGISHSVTGQARLLPGGELEAEVRAPVGSFKTGNATRDQNAMAAVQAEKYPDITVRAVVSAGAGSSGTVTARLQVELNGVKRDLATPVRIEWLSPGEAHVTGRFRVKLTDFQVKRPTLFLLPIGDDVPIDFDLTWKAVPPA